MTEWSYLRSRLSLGASTSHAVLMSITCFHTKPPCMIASIALFGKRLMERKEIDVRRRLLYHTALYNIIIAPTIHANEAIFNLYSSLIPSPNS